MPSRGLTFAFSSANSGSCVAPKICDRAELYINRNKLEENKTHIDELYVKRKSIETAFGGELTWERLDGKRAWSN